MCACGAEAAAAPKPTASPSPANATGAIDWATGQPLPQPPTPQWNNADWWNFDGGANTSCVSIDPGLDDDWCTITCATGSGGAGCPEERCKCGDEGKQEAKAVRQAAIDGFNEGQDRARAAAEAEEAGTPVDTTYGLPATESPVASATHVDPPVEMDLSCVGVAPYDSDSMDIWCAKNCARGERSCPPERCRCGERPSAALLDFVRSLISRKRGARVVISGGASIAS